MGNGNSCCSGSTVVNTDADEADPSKVRAKMGNVNWVPLESNPDMLNQFARGVGLPQVWEFVDVFGVEPDLLSMVPPSCVAVTLLFQCTANARKQKQEQQERIEKQTQKVSPNLVYMKQYVGNACGTIACLHSMANNQKVIGLDPSCAVSKFVEAIKGKTAIAAGEMLADASDLHLVSEASAAGGQTAAPAAAAGVDCHFICFVEKDGDVYELDGTKEFPINHGPSNGEFMKAVAEVVKNEFMKVDPTSIHFNMMALVKSSS